MTWPDGVAADRPARTGTGTLGDMGRSAVPAPQHEPNGRVLVVDDEPMVREVVTTYLERDGLTVIERGGWRSCAADARRGAP